MVNQLTNKRWLKDFDGWNALQQTLEKRRYRLPTFQEREIWFTAIGTNIGHETDGKNDDYSRPVLILKKYSRSLFFGLPLTTTFREGKWFYQLNTKRTSVVILNQGRTLSARRLTKRMYSINETDFEKIRELYRQLT